MCRINLLLGKPISKNLEREREGYIPNSNCKSKEVVNMLKFKEYLSRAIFLVWPEPRLSTTSHLSTTLVAPLWTITSILWTFVLVLELLNNLDIWNFLHFFSEKGFLVTANDESTETEYFSDGFAYPSSHVEIVTYSNAHIKLDIGITLHRRLSNR